MREHNIKNKNAEGGEKGALPRRAFISRTAQIASLAMFAALMIALQEALRLVAQFELVCFLVVLCTLLFGWRALFSVLVFCTLRLSIYGASPYTLIYFFVYPALSGLAIIPHIFFVRRGYNPLAIKISAALLCGLWGLLTGLMFLPADIIFWSSAGRSFAIWKYWLTGFLTTDIYHGISNAAVAYCLTAPLFTAINRTLKINK